MTASDFFEVDHTADWALRVRGASLPELFINAARGMYAITVDAPEVQPQVERQIHVTGVDAEALLVNWLNELLYYTEVEGLVFGRFEITSFAPDQLRAVARGQLGVPLRKQIKAVTFHNLKIVLSEGVYQVTLVFDV